MLSDYWNKYKTHIYANCTDPEARRNSVYYWQNRMFAASAIYIIPLSLVAVIPGLYMAYKMDLKPLLLVDFIAISTVLSIAFLPRISVFTRKILFNGVLYLVSVVLLHYLGSSGPGLLYLLGISVFVVLSLDRVYGLIMLALNTLICIYFALAIHYGFASTVILSEYQLDAWIAISANLVFLSGTAVLLIPKLFEGLQSAFDEQEELRRELEDTVDDLNAKNEELDRFSYIVSHDLKEPLRMVRSFMELLEKKYGDRLDDKAHSYIHYATDGADRMSTRINDLLEYSRIGRKYTSFEVVDLNAVLEEVTGFLDAEIKETGARVTVPDLPSIKAVPVAIKMLFQNLMANALKYQPAGQRPILEIAYREEEKHWQFSVSDNGIGIDPEYHEQIFAVFKRLHTAEEYGGSGMGLAICKKVAEQHGGDIWVESGKGNGSVFHFTIRKW
ncbi:ATP-binding protein [Halalkalibaculum sp. DA3122]|uniref:sensor histidine kinase n=1 Tax=unclassified Halalkalibaculum TaxID=2964617 RepID=UPI003754F08E